MLAFAVPPNSEKTLVPTYSDRLMRNFATHRDYRTDLAAATKPLTIIFRRRRRIDARGQICRSGARIAPPVDVKLIDGVNHMGIVSRARRGIRHRRRRRHARHGGVIAVMLGEGNMIDSQQASEALADINEMTRRVRQSRIYNLASLMLIMWGALVFAGYLGSFCCRAMPAISGSR